MQPVYVGAGLAWEKAEEERVARLLAAPAYGANVSPLARVEQPVTDVYPATHWALRGTPPAYNTPDSDVYLVGRNVLLLSKTAVYCALHGIRTIAVGPLAGNPFPDATPEFFAALSHALSLGLDHAIEVVAPFAHLDKPDVIRIGADPRRTLGADAVLHEPGRGRSTAAAAASAASGCRRSMSAGGRGSGAVRLAPGERRDGSIAEPPRSGARGVRPALQLRQQIVQAPHQPLALAAAVRRSRRRTRTAAETRWWRRSRRPRCPGARRD